jgi:hypothetical protein
MRREDCHPAPREALRWSLAPRYLAGVWVCVVSLAGSWLGRSAPTTPGPLILPPPHPDMSPGDRWRSPVPELPLWRPAPRSDPGGVLGARHLTSRTAAFRPRETVGFPLHTALRAILLSPTLLFSGLHHAACLRVPSSSVHPLLGLHVECTTDLLARRSSGGTCALALTHWGATTNVMGFRPIPRSRASLGATSAGFGQDSASRTYRKYNATLHASAPHRRRPRIPRRRPRRTPGAGVPPRPPARPAARRRAGAPGLDRHRGRGFYAATPSHLRTRHAPASTICAVV